MDKIQEGQQAGATDQQLGACRQGFRPEYCDATPHASLNRKSMRDVAHNVPTGGLFKNTTVLLLAVTVIGANAFLLSPILKTVGDSIHSNAPMTAWAVSAYGGATALSGLFLTGLLQPRGYRFTLFVGGALLAGGVAVTGLAGSLGFLVAGQALAGLGAGVILPAAYGATSVIAPEGGESRVMGWVIAGWSISLVLAVPTSAMIAHYVSWRYAYLVITLLALISVAGVATLPAERSNDNPRRSSITQALRVAWAPSTLLVSFLYMCAFYGVYTFLGDYTQRVLNQSTIGAGFVVLGYGLGFGLASVVGAVIDRYSPRTLAGPLLLILCAVYLAGVAAAGCLATLVLWAIVWGVFNQLGLNCLVTVLTHLSSEHGIRLLGLYSVAAYGGAMIAALVFGSLYQWAGFGAILVLASVLCMTAALIAVKLRRSQHAKRCCGV
ncbi:MFS transporter [Salinisphaera sp. LB1]|uniref:MFS transporter n=1 Tax=Salinisphaera sp. LB1 TaxID=2183911 RepID=UPI0011AB30D5|nr:MFS transporter [Salinisphaera sp. LB1]